MKKSIVFLLALGLSVQTAWAGLSKADVDQIKTKVTEFLKDDANYEEAIRVLDCGENLPPSADMILYFAYAPPTADDLNPTTIRRMDIVGSLYNRGLAKRIIVTGNGYPEKNVARKGADYLVTQKGVDPSHLIMDDTSKTTRYNIQHGLEIFAREGVRSVIFVSSPYHLDRIHRLFEFESKNFKKDWVKPQVFWSSFDHRKEDDNPEEKRKQVAVEVDITIRNHYEGGMPFRSAACSAIDQQRGTVEGHQKFFKRVIEYCGLPSAN